MTSQARLSGVPAVIQRQVKVRPVFFVVVVFFFSFLGQNPTEKCYLPQSYKRAVAMEY